MSRSSGRGQCSLWPRWSHSWVLWHQVAAGVRARTFPRWHSHMRSHRSSSNHADFSHAQLGYNVCPGRPLILMLYDTSVLYSLFVSHTHTHPQAMTSDYTCLLLSEGPTDIMQCTAFVTVLSLVVYLDWWIKMCNYNGMVTCGPIDSIDIFSFPYIIIWYCLNRK